MGYSAVAAACMLSLVLAGAHTIRPRIFSEYLGLSLPSIKFQAYAAVRSRHHHLTRPKSQILHLKLTAMYCNRRCMVEMVVKETNIQLRACYT